ncbi:hypothetical protein Taro_014629 [Colocasia esculenta]|uniref:Peptidase M48 domain-containing protein n=1 Tax=Colocasia esculenta TaxID=4460 RepID=A0A843U9I7_COLES|nr:hypothetical protein [Colocasia esculenta]
MNFLRKSRPAIRSFFGGLAPRARGAPPPPVVPRPALPCSRASVFFGAACPRPPLYLPPHKAGFTGGSRSYYVDRYQVQHFRRRGARRWFENPRTVLIVVVRQLGEAQFAQLKAELRDKILPPTHPDSIRVRLIAKDLVQALQKGLQKHEHVWRDPEYTSGVATVPSPAQDAGDPWRASGWEEEAGGRGDFKWSGKDEMLDDKWVEQSRKAGKVKGLQPPTRHLEGLNWEVVVVRNPITNAMCLPGGKIIVFTGLLDHFRSDAEIATVIGHEVGHAIARHSAETITKNLWLAVLQLILFQFFAMPDLINAMSNLLLKLPFSRRMEMEADYIGLLLLAAAGYDPRVAPMVYKKLGEITGDSMLRDYLSTHPSSKKRAELLSRAQVMGEALAIYREAIAGHGVEGFL